jgi:hypothetical protein
MTERAPGRPLTRASRACRSRVRYPNTPDEQRAAAFIVGCRTRGCTLTYDQIVRLLNEHFPRLGRGQCGRWHRWLVRRVVLRAHEREPHAVVRHVPRARG